MSESQHRNLALPTEKPAKHVSEMQKVLSDWPVLHNTKSPLEGDLSTNKCISLKNVFILPQITTFCYFKIKIYSKNHVTNQNCFLYCSL